MKKYFIIAVAAVAAMAACSKVEVDETATPATKIGFEVANYARQTKANSSLTNAEDGIYKFHTFAYQFPEIGSPREFMNVDIFAWQEAAKTNKLTSGTSPVMVWAPEQDYYWPKTGHINFYSYAGSHTPAETVNSTGDWKTVTFTYTDAVIEATSNILVADAALHQGRANSGDNAYEVDNNGSDADVTAGVPTLFHHQLAKITFDVEARTTDLKKSANTIWKVQVLNKVTATNLPSSQSTRAPWLSATPMMPPPPPPRPGLAPMRARPTSAVGFLLVTLPIRRPLNSMILTFLPSPLTPPATARSPRSWPSVP